MKEFKDKVAVITGAASGLGRAIVNRCVREGMKVVLADIDEKTLAKTKEELKAMGATLIAVPTDVSKISDVEALAQRTLEAFGAVHLLFNNAGVVTFGPIWKSTLADWKWVMGVNLWGVIHGIQIFVPIMLKQDTESHIVNTASLAGLISGPGCGIYIVTKHGVVALSEILYHELAHMGAKVKISVLCPGFINTRLGNSERNRPVELQNNSAEEIKNSEVEQPRQFFCKAVRAGVSPYQVADYVFNAIKDEKFYILTHPESKQEIKTRMEDILQERNPTSLE
ncbi:SDR family NAD(P)-dependent oxidoreductase [Candidatus Bathyarchaeota archaeon]|nr:SDR family NAD(P)-dependent oxidoreductase [Candidatus Bathyarchaeota archaeon]